MPGRGSGVDGHSQKPASVEVSESLEVVSEQPSRIETLGNKEAGSKPKQRQQGTLDAFGKPLEKSEKPDGKMRGETRMEEESRRVEDVDRVKEEPMDEGETDFGHIVEQDSDEEEEVEEADPFHYESKKPKKKPEAGQTEERLESKAEQKVDGGKRSSKRTANWSDENDGESSRAQTSRENDGGGMWKKKARIDVFSQVCVFFVFRQSIVLYTCSYAYTIHIDQYIFIFF